MQQAAPEGNPSPKSRFGVFEFDPKARELTKYGVRVKLQEQPSQILATLLEQAGRTVPREELQRQLWPDGTFVDYEQSLNKAVNKLREALNDDAGQPRYIETVPRRGYRFIAPVTGAAPVGALPDVSAQPAPQAGVRTVAIILAAGVLLVSGMTTVVLLRSPKTPQQPPPIRITNDGNSIQPVLSRDGKLLAYASSGGGGLGHIWVRQTGGGDAALQVTRGAGGESEPSFSPDGTSIAFRSETDGGGVYIVPTIGGEPRLVAKGALWPRFSPDGEQIWCINSGDLGFRGVLAHTRSGALAALPLNFFWLEPFLGYQSVPVWAPNGKQILYLVRGNGSVEARPPQWRIGSLSGTESKEVKTLDWDGRREHLPFAHAWAQMNDGRQWIVYSVPTGDSRSLFRVAISRDGEILGKPEQLTYGVGYTPDATLSQDGKLAFSSTGFTEEIHAIPITTNSADRGRQYSRVARSSGLRNNSPSISRDGRWLAYGTTDLYESKITIRLRDLVNGTDRLLVEHIEPPNDFISISPDGSKVVFSDFANGRDSGGDASCFVIAAGGGLQEKISANCEAPRGFSSDGSAVLVQRRFRTTPEVIVAVDFKSKQERTFLSHAHKDLYHAFFAWDDRWVVFKTGEEWNRAQLLVAPVRDGVAAAEAEWIAVTDGHYADDKPQFSPDGNQIYFTSDRDGYLCLWAQPLNHATKRPEGTPYVVQHLHNAGWFLKSYYPFGVSLSVARDKIVTNLAEFHSDIWMMQLH